VLACCVGVPAVVLAYRGKCEDFMSSMGLPEFAVPVAEEKSPVLLRERWQEVLSRGELGQRIYRTALAWKGVQRGYFERMSERLRARGSD
jgi:polysaccharide pyruvyl transferase WcaK-like protein